MLKWIGIYRFFLQMLCTAFYYLYHLMILKLAKLFLRIAEAFLKSNNNERGD